MDVAQALLTAIEYEKRVSNVYAEALGEARCDAARRVFELLGKEEKDHVAYLENKLAKFRADGTLDGSDLATALPDVASIRRGADKLAGLERKAPSHEELDALKRALEVETETSGFYAEMAEKLDPKARAFFARFRQIEDGHLALVSAEMTALEGTGYWFDVAEFQLEMA